MRKYFPACLVLLGVFASPPLVRAQGFDTGYFRTNEYPRSNSLTFTPVGAPAAEQWFTDDPYVVMNIFVTNRWVTKGVGDTTLVTFVNNYTIGTNARSSSSNSVTFGTYAWSSLQYYDYLPGRTNPSVFKWFPAAVMNSKRTATFVAEFSLIRTTDVSFPNKDKFGFELFTQTTNGGVTNRASLARFDFNPLASILTNANTYLFEWHKGGLQQTPAGSGLTGNWPLTYGTIYRLTATITGSQLDLVMNSLSGPAGTNVATFRVIDRGELAGGYTVTDFNTLAVNWRLTSTNPYAPGSKNYILLNRLAVQPVPTAIENWLVAGGLPASTSISTKSDGRAFTPLEEYAMGAALLGTAFEVPSFKHVADSGGSLELTSVVRTNDPSISVTAEAVSNLGDFASSNTVTAVPGTALAVDQSGVPSGCERRAFRVSVNGGSRLFLRLRVRTDR
jgi:hypothetical protein